MAVMAVVASLVSRCESVLWNPCLKCDVTGQSPQMQLLICFSGYLVGHRGIISNLQGDLHQQKMLHHWPALHLLKYWNLHFHFLIETLSFDFWIVGCKLQHIAPVAPELPVARLAQSCTSHHHLPNNQATPVCRLSPRWRVLTQKTGGLAIKMSWPQSSVTLSSHHHLRCTAVRFVMRSWYLKFK